MRLMPFWMLDFAIQKMKIVNLQPSTFQPSTNFKARQEAKGKGKLFLLFTVYCLLL